jgi:hypothetical protein
MSRPTLILKQLHPSATPFLQRSRNFSSGSAGKGRRVMDNNEINKLQAIAALDNPYGTPSQWVIDLRASSRYLGALFVIAMGIGTLFLSVTPEIQRIGIEAANIAFGFLFGTRIMANLKK